MLYEPLGFSYRYDRDYMDRNMVSSEHRHKLIVWLWEVDIDRQDRYSQAYETSMFVIKTVIFLCKFER